MVGVCDVKSCSYSEATVIREKGEMTFIQRPWIDGIAVNQDEDKQLPELMAGLYEACFLQALVPFFVTLKESSGSTCGLEGGICLIVIHM